MDSPARRTVPATVLQDLDRRLVNLLPADEGWRAFDPADVVVSPDAVRVADVATFPSGDLVEIVQA